MTWTTYAEQHNAVEARWGAFNAPPDGDVARVALGLAIAFPERWVRVLVLGQTVIEGRGRFLAEMARTAR